LQHTKTSFVLCQTRKEFRKGERCVKKWSLCIVCQTW